MEITIKDIFKEIVKKWYILVTTISIFIVIGTVISIVNYNKPNYVASSSFLFSNEPTVSNVNLYIGNCRAYLLTDTIRYNISNIISSEFAGERNKDYTVTIEVISATLAIKVESENNQVAERVLQEYSAVIMSDENPIKRDDLIIEIMVPQYVKEIKASLSSLIIQIALFTFIGIFLGGVIVLAPMYNEKVKEERRRYQELQKHKYKDPYNPEI